MGRDKIKSASLHSFHEPHTEPSVARIPFETLVREMLEQLARIRSAKGSRGRPPASRPRSSG